MPTEQTRSTIEEYLRRQKAGDIQGMLDLVAEPVDWDVPGADVVPWAGPRTTHAQIQEFFDLLVQYLQLDEFRVETIVADGEHGVAIGRLWDTVRATGDELTTAFAVHYTVVDGKITRYCFYEDSHGVAVALAKVAESTGDAA